MDKDKMDALVQEAMQWLEDKSVALGETYEFCLALKDAVARRNREQALTVPFTASDHREQ